MDHKKWLMQIHVSNGKIENFSFGTFLEMREYISSHIDFIEEKIMLYAYVKNEWRRFVIWRDHLIFHQDFERLLQKFQGSKIPQF